MKFGKQLVKASMVSVQLCEPQLWLDYKKLKKFLKNIQPSNGQDISHSLDERKFFTLLKSEVRLNGSVLPNSPWYIVILVSFMTFI